MKDWEAAIPADGWETVTKRVPLWASVPPAFRVERDEAERLVNARIHSDIYREKEMRRYEPDGCEIAVTTSWAPGRLVPCGRSPFDEAVRCVIHGGPANNPQVRRRRELETLRDRVAELEARLGESGDA